LSRDYQVKTQLHFEIFNVFNILNLAQPDSCIRDDRDFGLSNRTHTEHRQWFSWSWLRRAVQRSVRAEVDLVASFQVGVAGQGWERLRPSLLNPR